MLASSEGLGDSVWVLCAPRVPHKVPTGACEGLGYSVWVLCAPRGPHKVSTGACEGLSVTFGVLCAPIEGLIRCLLGLVRDLASVSGLCVHLECLIRGLLGTWCQCRGIVCMHLECLTRCRLGLDYGSMSTVSYLLQLGANLIGGKLYKRSTL